MHFDQARTSNDEKHIAILCLTENGRELAERLATYFSGCNLYIPSRLLDLKKQSEESNHPKLRVGFDDWQTAFAESFHNHSALICIMATGIVVRSLAGLMVSKLTDPAVVVVDEKGEYAISLLSGHIGGANQLAREVAVVLGGQVVITTASDVSGKTSVDLLAMDIDALLDPPVRIKTINRYLAESKVVHLYSPWPLLEIPQGFHWQGWPTNPHRPIEEGFAAQLLEPAVLISPWKIPLDASREWLQLRPRNLVVGIGCRRDVGFDEVQQALLKVLEGFCLDIASVSKLATIALKAREPTLQSLAAWLNIPLLTFNAEEIETLDGSYEPSVWVKEKVGVGGVCEPAARLASGRGLTLVPKQKIGAVTISIAMEKSWWWDWDQAVGIS
jgi:cobalt-precorrin 5A hydrolase